jgi:AcrR family transcriptional regulator
MLRGLVRLWSGPPRCYACPVRTRTPARRKPERKAEVLSAFVDYLLKTGMLDLSLRPAAAALHTSPRMLVYYFGSKQRLLLAAIAEVRSRERARFARDIQRRRFGGSVARDIWTMWRWFTGKPREPYLRLFYELYARAASRPAKFKSFLDLISEDYIHLMEEGLVGWGFARAEAKTHATLHLATFRGLLLDLLTTGERGRVDAAAKLLAANVERELTQRRPALRGDHPVPASLQPLRG